MRGKTTPLTDLERRARVDFALGFSAFVITVLGGWALVCYVLG